MNILVIGANGQLGRSLQKISRDFPSHDFSFTELPETDITDRDNMLEHIGDSNPDVIVNCAAYTAVDKAESEPEEAERVNTGGCRTLAEAAVSVGAKLVHISTDYVFGGCACIPFKEDDPASPLGVYGKTKLDGEKEIENSECEAAVIRTGWLYSEYGNNFVKTMLRLGSERESVDVVYDQVGTPTYATDLALAVMRIIDNGIADFEIYNYTNEGAVSWYDFAKVIFTLSGIDVKVSAILSENYPAPAKRPHYSVLSKDKIKAAGAKVPFWVDSLKICLNEIKKH